MFFDNVRDEVSEIFGEFKSELSLEEKYSLNYVRQVFEVKNTDTTTRHFEVYKAASNENTEYLEVVANMYSKDLVNCKKCKSQHMLYRLDGRRSWMCFRCGWQIYPTANTIFHKSTTPLKYWFVIIQRMARGNVVIADVQRNFGMTYKTALRMVHLIRGEEFYPKIVEYYSHISDVGSMILSEISDNPPLNINYNDIRLEMQKETRRKNNFTNNKT